MLKTMKWFVALVLAVILSSSVVPAIAASEAEETTTTCIMINLIRRVEVVDNQTLLFHMNGKKIWKNTLPFPCMGLKFEGGISYKTSINKLCSGEIVTVTRRPDTTCTLGSFTLYEEVSE